MPKSIKIVLIVLCVAVIALLIGLCVTTYNDVRSHAVRSYVLSVCNAVENFYKEHGHYPESLGRVDQSLLDYDLQIPLHELDYEITSTGFRISYRINGRHVVSCP